MLSSKHLMNKKGLNLLSINICLAPFIWRPSVRVNLFSKQAPVASTDIINLQEVHTYDMVLVLRKRLADFPFIVYQPGLLGPRAGLVTFSKIPLAFDGFKPLKSTSLPKGILVSRLETGLAIANVHLEANTDGDWSIGNRFYPKHKQQLDQLNELLACEKTVILSGDFNLAKTSDLYDYFVEKGGWQDTTPSDFEPTFHAEFLPKDRQPQRIDYIFTKGGLHTLSTLRVFEGKVEGRYLSNHVGLAARFS